MRSQDLSFRAEVEGRLGWPESSQWRLALVLDRPMFANLCFYKKMPLNSFG